ncbi:MAG TPA: hypothetical protein ENJ43_06625 [Gammaproteobacteria bacterium]|nr:hypothetical protein [Gammaproteobacteria bacterium]
MRRPLLAATLAAGIFLLAAACSQGGPTKPAAETIPLHRKGDDKLSCRQLDVSIQRLYVQAQQLAPRDFTSDESNVAAATVGTFAFTPAYLHILKNELLDKPEQRKRIEAIAARIHLLRNYKAERHCYESR